MENICYFCTVKRFISLLKLSFLVILVHLTSVARASGQQGDTIEDDSWLDSVEVSLLTCGPAPEIYSLYGPRAPGRLGGQLGCLQYAGAVFRVTVCLWPHRLPHGRVPHAGDAGGIRSGKTMDQRAIRAPLQEGEEKAAFPPGRESEAGKRLLPIQLFLRQLHHKAQGLDCRQPQPQ